MKACRTSECISQGGVCWRSSARRPSPWLRVGLQAAGLALALLTVGVALHWPVKGVWVAAGLVAYAIGLARYPLAWLWLLPPAVALLDGMPWTGWLHFGEVELLLMMTFAVALLRWPAWQSDCSPALPALLPAPLRFSFYGLLASTALGVGVAVWWWLTQAPGPWVDYAAPWNTARTASGVLLALGALLLVRYAPDPPREQFLRGLVPGMALGCLAAVAAVVRERAAYPGLWDTESGFRVAGWFTDMHVGGPSLAAFLALTIPFALVWAWTRPRRPTLWTLAVSLLVSYATVVTFTRSAWLAVAVALLVLALFGGPLLADAGGRSRRSSILLAWIPIPVAIGIALAMLDGFASDRWSTTTRDAEGRWDRWATILAISAETARTPWIGHGVGTFPAAYRTAPQVDDPVGQYGFLGQGETAMLWMGEDPTGRLAQRLSAAERPEWVDVVLRVQGPPGARLRVALCEESVVYPVRCAERWIQLDGLGEGSDPPWRGMALRLAPPAGRGMPGLERSLVFSLSRQDGLPGPLLMDDVRVLGSDGSSLLSNGTFAAGGRHWFYTTSNYDAWRTENQLLEFYFDQGIAGAVLWLVLVVAGLWALAPYARAPTLAALAAAAGITGALAVGMFATIFFNPHIALLFYLALLLGVAAGHAGRGDGRLGETGSRDREGR